MEKNVKSIYNNNNKFKILAPTWNETVDLPDGSYNISEMQNYIEYIINKHETIVETAPILIYTNKISNSVQNKNWILIRIIIKRNNEIIRKY